MKYNLSHNGPDGGRADSGTLMFRNRLHLLHQAANDLSTVDSFDELCRQSVALGRRLLEWQRIGIWFRKNDSMLVSGSFGVDENGDIRDERAQLLTAYRHSPMGQVINGEQTIVINNNCALHNDKGETVGKGIHIVAALRNGSRVIGCICMDNLLDQKQFREEDFDTVKMYASLIGHLASRKRAEDELKKTLKENEILSREINHRVKNNLQVISSLLSLQSVHIHDAYDAELFRQTQGRIKSMAKIYDVLQQSEDLTRINIHDYIMGIIQDMFQFHQLPPSSIVVRWEGHHESFSLSQAIPCSLIMNELLTNAFKHGFKHGKPDNGHIKGELTIAVRRMDENLFITIGNNGAPFPPDVDIYHPLSLGLQLVNILVSQLNGTLVLDKTHGTFFTVSFPETTKGSAPNLNGEH